MPAIQATQFCFLIVEPHCSIVAGCLPTLGPLVAGGRAAESLVRSVRSLISLASGGSSPRGSKGKTAVRLPSNTESLHDLTEVEGPQRQPPLQSTTEVQIKSNRSEDHGDTMELTSLDGGINVTRGVDVVRA